MKTYQKIARLLEQIHIGYTGDIQSMMDYNCFKLEHEISLPRGGRVLIDYGKPGEGFDILQRNHVITVTPDLLEEIWLDSGANAKDMTELLDFLMEEI